MSMKINQNYYLDILLLLPFAIDYIIYKFALTSGTKGLPSTTPTLLASSSNSSDLFPRLLESY